ncbi:hypothetical protein CJD36_016810 [Flavipsychrobacter stenotrophus]|uniref:DNA (cytosine-5-)-methyltransferase n=1 Tax=Flavipsychrobacter stenotrophus TaxID=2077091 RepID=A0A2S7SRR8_9BACT|nr:DNA cytosine methyltransferase [Flavipsychrobacter stenotrophus]PQJ09600.1 hypothetical protein CJD36_016810 [Flavipsychrobacter stenotrophus]
MNKKPIAIGLFSNLRGIEIGAQRADFYTPFSTDIEKDVRELFEANHKNMTAADMETFYTADVCDLVFADIQRELRNIGITINKGDIDCLVGGPPCFGMTSLSSNRSVFHPLNMLMFEMLRIVEEAQPKTVFIEQVPRFMSDEMRPFRDMVYSKMNKMTGYDWDIRVLNAENFGAFQSRDRVTIIGVRKDLKVKPSFPLLQPVDFSKQSAFATVGAEFYRSGQFKQRPQDGITKVFGTMTGGDSEEIYKNDRWQKLTIQERLILTDMTNYDFSTWGSARTRDALGNMVMPQFAEAIMKHIHYEILMKSALYNC